MDRRWLGLFLYGFVFLLFFSFYVNLLGKLFARDSSFLVILMLSVFYMLFAFSNLRLIWRKLIQKYDNADQITFLSRNPALIGLEVFYWLSVIGYVVAEWPF